MAQSATFRGNTYMLTHTGSAVLVMRSKDASPGVFLDPQEQQPSTQPVTAPGPDATVTE